MAYDPTIDHVSVVIAAKAQFASEPPSDARAWRIVNETARRLVALGERDAGLHRKSGTNYMGYAVDIVGYRDSGELYDALGSAGVEDRPQWYRTSGTLNWAPPVGPVDPPDDDLAALTERVAALERWAGSFR